MYDFPSNPVRRSEFGGFPSENPWFQQQNSSRYNRGPSDYFVRPSRQAQLMEEQHLQQMKQKQKLIEQQRLRQEKLLTKLQTSALKIQKTWRGYRVRKDDLLKRLRTLNNLESKFQETVQRYAHVLQFDPEAPIELQESQKLQRDVIVFEETLTTYLLAIDSIQVLGSSIIRERRKSIVQRIEQVLFAIEPVKRIIVERVQRQREQKALEIEQAKEIHEAGMEEMKGEEMKEIPVVPKVEMNDNVQGDGEVTQKSKNDSPLVDNEAEQTKELTIEDFHKKNKDLLELLQQRDQRIRELELEITRLRSKL